MPLNENKLLKEDGNQYQEQNKAIYHYMRADVNPHLDAGTLRYFERIKRDNPLLAKVEFYGLPGVTEGMVLLILCIKLKLTLPFSLEKNLQQE